MLLARPAFAAPAQEPLNPSGPAVPNALQPAAPPREPIALPPAPGEAAALLSPATAPAPAAASPGDKPFTLAGGPIGGTNAGAAPHAATARPVIVEDTAAHTSATAKADALPQPAATSELASIAVVTSDDEAPAWLVPTIIISAIALTIVAVISALVAARLHYLDRKFSRGFPAFTRLRQGRDFMNP